MTTQTATIDKIGRRRRTRKAPSWSTIRHMEQARWLRTAKMHAAVLPPELAHLPTSTEIDPFKARQLAAFCQHHDLPIARAGHHT